MILFPSCPGKYLVEGWSQAYVNAFNFIPITYYMQDLLLVHKNFILKEHSGVQSTLGLLLDDKEYKHFFEDQSNINQQF